KLDRKIPDRLAGRNIGVVCHAASITSDFRHAASVIAGSGNCRLGALFGPQHGIFGETQDNMIEWEGGTDTWYNVPLHSLYGRNRKPTPQMLKGLDALVIDLQDTGARLYTYIWTMHLCMEAAGEAGIPVWICDRPNPVSFLGMEGPVLKPPFFTFVGMAAIPMMHSMTIGEIALWIRDIEGVRCDLHIVGMDGWKREMPYAATRLPWVLPSPNMPTTDTALVYPGMVLAEATNLSEGRGTTRPFELFGAPWLIPGGFLNDTSIKELKGVHFRRHNFIPVFHKFSGLTCTGFQIHITDLKQFRPVETAVAIFDAAIRNSDGNFSFLDPPYEYEETLMPFDILSGDSGIREMLINGGSLKEEKERWRAEQQEFAARFSDIRLYD
ncbi:MAG: DUF1343 domain-containing protein, partial [Bacteroidales bacterium]|nr:DUF1343 domain-containing protein [Bacteroidales bacterium]